MVLRKGRSGAFLTRVAFVCLLPIRAGSPQDQPKLLNPFAGDAEAVKEGRRLYMANGCSACHGLMGGGGMGKPIPQVWKMLAYVRSLHKGDRSLINWGLTPSPSQARSPSASPLPSPPPSAFKPPNRRRQGAHEPSSSPQGHTGATD